MGVRLRSILIVSLFVVGGFAGFLHFGSENAEGTPVSGLISTDTIWDLAGSPYIVVGNVTVEVGTSLIISPGVVVKFDGYYSLNVDGDLTAVGTEINRINITSNKTPPNTGDWRRIKLNATGRAEIRYSDISFANVGIYVTSSPDNAITNNKLSYIKQGIWLESFSYNNLISNNSISHCEFEGIDITTGSNNNTVTFNNILSNDGLGIYLWMQTTDNQISNNEITNNWAGIYLKHASKNLIKDNNILSSTNYGIYLEPSSNNNTIADNDVLDNEFGIVLDVSFHNIIERNNVSMNSIEGIRLSASSYNTIIENDVFGNENGVILDAAPNNRIYHNNIINNTNQAGDDLSNNLWQDDYPSGGNYWSDWSPGCQDLYSGPSTPQTTGSPDGICDQEYTIDGDSSDFYPLKGSFVILPPAPDTTPPTITELHPANGSTIIRKQLLISVLYIDDTGINTTSVILKVDGIDVTSSANITETGISYDPPSSFEGGFHTVYLEVCDNSSNQNKATVSWSFTFDASAHGQGDLIKDYWWIFLLVILGSLLVIVLYQMMMKRRRKREEPPETLEEPEELDIHS
jgi:parallel beta-helix repeat protein